MTTTTDNLMEWIINIIDSCTNQFHFDGVDRLIELYYEREKDDEKRTELMLIKQKKFNELHNILY